MSIYKVDTDNFSDAIEELVTAFRRANPTIDGGRFQLVGNDGTKINFTIAKPKKQRGTVKT